MLYPSLTTEMERETTMLLPSSPWVHLQKIQLSHCTNLCIHNYSNDSINAAVLASSRWFSFALLHHDLGHQYLAAPEAKTGMYLWILLLKSHTTYYVNFPFMKFFDFRRPRHWQRLGLRSSFKLRRAEAFSWLPRLGPQSHHRRRILTSNTLDRTTLCWVIRFMQKRDCMCYDESYLQFQFSSHHVFNVYMNVFGLFLIHSRVKRPK